MLVLLPRRILLGDAFFADKVTNIFILRQMINVLPIIFAAVILVFYKTQFRHVFQSIFLFLLFLILPSVVRSNIWWWHPDSLTFLFIALTFFFLQKDDYQLDKNFYLSAAMCGLATGTKLLGVFFFLTIPVYLALAHFQHSVNWRKIVLKGFLFVCVMITVIILVNPFLWYETPRQEMIAIQRFQQKQLREGYSHDNPKMYQKSPIFWEWTLENWFGSILFLCFLGMSTIFGAIYEKNSHANLYLITWSIPYLIYIFYFVAPKPDHYVFPALAPIFLTALDIPIYFYKEWKNLSWPMKGIAVVVICIISVLLFQQIKFSIEKDIPLYRGFLRENM